MDYLPEGDCFTLLKKKYSDPTTFDLMKFALAITECLIVLRDNNIAHLDIKLENILCVDSENYIFVMTDFDTIKFIDDKNAYQLQNDGIGFHTTFPYVAPEIFYSCKYNLNSDVYVLGIFLLMLFSKINNSLINVMSQRYSINNENDMMAIKKFYNSLENGEWHSNFKLIKNNEQMVGMF